LLRRLVLLQEAGDQAKMPFRPANPAGQHALPLVPDDGRHHRRRVVPKHEPAAWSGTGQTVPAAQAAGAKRLAAKRAVTHLASPCGEEKGTHTRHQQAAPAGLAETSGAALARPTA